MEGSDITPPLRLSRRANLGRIAAKLEPHGQGDFDGLCGLYSTINAVRLLLAANGFPFSFEQCEQLFRTGVEFLDSQDRLVYGAHWGISLSLWRKLGDRLFRRAGRMSGVRIRVERPFAPRRLVPQAMAYGAIGDAAAQRRPVLMLLRGAYSHYTVISAVTDARFMLFDSYGFRWISRASCSVGATTPPRRHQMAPASLTILSMMEGEDETA